MIREMTAFNDHFSGHAAQYSAFRPLWPAELFAWLSRQSHGHDLAWDCATGNGQAAIGLKPYFRQVIASDASQAQIDNVKPDEGVEYRVEPAEKSSLPGLCVDLLMVAQAYHWFDHDIFHSEANRVLKPGGLLAIAAYQLLSVNKSVDQLIRALWGDVLCGWWPPERVLIDQGLDNETLPFSSVETPKFSIIQQWTLSDLLNYLSTWSAVRRFSASEGVNPVDMITPALEKTWGDSQKIRKVSWPISLNLRRKPA